MKRLENGLLMSDGFVWFEVKNFEIATSMIGNYNLYIVHEDETESLFGDEIGDDPDGDLYYDAIIQHYKSGGKLYVEIGHTK